MDGLDLEGCAWGLRLLLLAVFVARVFFVDGLLELGVDALRLDLPIQVLIIVNFGLQSLQVLPLFSPEPLRLLAFLLLFSSHTQRCRDRVIHDICLVRGYPAFFDLFL